MIKKLLLLFFMISFPTFAQDSNVDKLFSNEIGNNIKKYKQSSQIAFEEKDYVRAEFLFDSLVDNVVKNSFIDNFKVKKLSGRKVKLYDFKKPIFLMTYASWCTPGAGEIPALNEIANKYHKEIDFIVLFWDTKKKVRKATRDYSKKFTILYVDELENEQNHMVATIKHSLGFPTTFFIDKNKKIIDIRRGVQHPYDEDFNVSYNLYYNAFANGIALLKNFALNSDIGSALEQNP